jgi:hypothetical protein
MTNNRNNRVNSLNLPNVKTIESRFEGEELRDVTGIGKSEKSLLNRSLQNSPSNKIKNNNNKSFIFSVS